MVGIEERRATPAMLPPLLTFLTRRRRRLETISAWDAAAADNL